MLIDRVRADLQEATKKRELVAMGALRMLISALEYLEKSGEKVDLAGELAVVKLEVKKRREAIEAYEKAGRAERVEIERAEMEVVKKYLPEQASDEEVRMVAERLVKEMGGEVNKGQLIGRVIAEVGRDKVDGSVVSRVVNEVVG